LRLVDAPTPTIGGLVSGLVGRRLGSIHQANENV
jgi:hypothetical protein